MGDAGRVRVAGRIGCAIRVDPGACSRESGGLAMIIPAKEQTSAAVAQHYDDLDLFYRELWGDHVHHGLWTTGLENPAQAVENLIACVARRLELDPGQHVCDVGCGYGATAQWLAEHHGVHVTGLTIS